MNRHSKFIILLLLLLGYSSSNLAAEAYTIEQLQGAWWSDPQNQSADFMIQGQQVWLDFDARFHPCEIEGELLIFQVSAEIGNIENRIISISGNRLILENSQTNKTTEYLRVE